MARLAIRARTVPLAAECNAIAGSKRRANELSFSSLRCCDGIVGVCVVVGKADLSSVENFYLQGHEDKYATRKGEHE